MTYGLRRCFFYICWPGLWLYFRIGDRSRVIIRCDGETVIVKGWWDRLFADDRWGLPGGGRSRRETPAEGACRELSEELGLTVNPADLTFIGRRHVSDNGIGYDADFFTLDFTVKPMLTAQAETTAIEWSKLSEPGDYKNDIIASRQLERVDA